MVTLCFPKHISACSQEPHYFSGGSSQMDIEIGGGYDGADGADGADDWRVLMIKNKQNAKY